VVLVHQAHHLFTYVSGRSPKVCAVQEFKNSPANHLVMRFQKNACYSIGATMIVNSNSPARTTSITPPNDETIRLYTGNAFDMTGERRRTNTAQISMRGGCLAKTKLSKKP